MSPVNFPWQLSAMDYSNHIARHYPFMAKQPIAVLLREQNARAIRHVTTARHNIQTDMVNFTDKLMATLASNCTCYAARGFSDCPLRMCNANPASKATTAPEEAAYPPSANLPTIYRTPVSTKIHGVRLELSESEGKSSSQRLKNAKRLRPSGSSSFKQHPKIAKNT